MKVKSKTRNSTHSTLLRVDPEQVKRVEGSKFETNPKSECSNVLNCFGHLNFGNFSGAHFVWSLCLVSCVLFSGCGYTTKSILPKSIQTIYVEPFKNNIDFTTGTGRNVYLPLLEVDARNAVINRFLFDGNLKIAKPEAADLILKGDLNGYNRSGLRYTDDDDVEEYRVHVTVSFELWNTKKDELSWAEPNFTGEATYFVTGPEVSTEDSAIDKAIVDLARRIVERTIEDW